MSGTAHPPPDWPGKEKGALLRIPTKSDLHSAVTQARPAVQSGPPGQGVSGVYGDRNIAVGGNDQQTMSAEGVRCNEHHNADVRSQSSSDAVQVVPSELPLLFSLAGLLVAGPLISSPSEASNPRAPSAKPQIAELRTN